MLWTLIIYNSLIYNKINEDTPYVMNHNTTFWKSFPSIYSPIRIIHRRPSPLSIKSKALLISENGNSCVMNFSNSSSCTKSTQVHHASMPFYSFIIQLWSYKKGCYLIHILFNHRRNIWSRFIVSKKSSLQSPFVQQIQWTCLENSIFMWNTHKNSNTPTL